MIFDTVGRKGNPVIVMINGSYTSGKSFLPLAQELSDDYYVILPTYDGHHENGGIFTTRKQQAQKILQYLLGEDIHEITLLHGLSMGAEVALDLAYEISVSKPVTVKKCIFDGGPFFHFNPIMRKIMQKKFMKVIHDLQKGSFEEVWTQFQNNKMIQWMAQGEISSYKEMIQGMAEAAPYMSDQSIRNESDACYTFDFPEIPKEEQKKYCFTWSDDEPAYKSAKKIRSCYPEARYLTAGYMGHAGFITKKPEEYVEFIRSEVTS